MNTSENRGLGLFRSYHSTCIRYGTKDFLVTVRDSYTEMTFIALTRSCERQSQNVTSRCAPWLLFWCCVRYIKYERGRKC